MSRQLELSIYRYQPQKDKKPYQQSFQIDEANIPGKMLLDAILYVKEHCDPTLSLRRSCREGVCGSDGMNINGRNGLACITPLSSLPKKIILRPLPGLPVIRDLVVNMDGFYRQYEKVQPYLINDKETPVDSERLQTPEERAQLDGTYECILCGCCTTACPSYWWNPDKFIGPAGLLQASRFIFDSRDSQRQTRLDNLRDPFSVFRCRGIMNCVSVCPKGLNPTKAIAQVRNAMLTTQNKTDE